MKLISLKICPYVQQVRVLLEAKNARYEVEHIDGGNRPQWLMNASPDGGEGPLLITDEGEHLFQSDTIVEYIDDVVGDPLLTGSPLTIARDKAWGRLASDNYLVQCSTQRSPDEATLKERLEDLMPICQATERQLKDGPYFHGSGLSMVDISWIPLLHRTALIEKYTRYDFLAAYPKLMDWRHALLDTGLQSTSVSEDFEALFRGFYLNKETYLGRLVGTRSS